MIGHLLAARWWWSPLAAAWLVIAAGVSAALPDRPHLEVLAIPPDHAVLVDVVDLGRRAHNGVAVVGCGEVVARERLGGDTYRFLLEDVEGDCALRAVRWDGVMPASSASVVIPAGAVSSDVTLTLPRWRAGGLGVRLDLADDAVYVSDLLDGLGADRAGVRSGERIVAIDGLRVGHMDIDEFRALVAGPEGQSVGVTLSDGGDATREVRVTRSYLSGDR